MSNTTLILGESGSGKSTSLRNLDPDSTFIINVLDKPLPFRGGKLKFNSNKKNYFATDNYAEIIKTIDVINRKYPEVKTLIIDDLQYVMANEFIRRAKEQGFTKFTELAQHIWEIINELCHAREDLYCFVLSHSEVDSQGTSRCKTIGKMLDEKITLEGMFTCVFHCIVSDSGHKFLTQNDGSHIAKSPMGMFDSIYVENDLSYVLIKMKDYFSDEGESNEWFLG